LENEIDDTKTKITATEWRKKTLSLQQPSKYLPKRLTDQVQREIESSYIKEKKSQGKNKRISLYILAVSIALCIVALLNFLNLKFLIPASKEWHLSKWWVLFEKEYAECFYYVYLAIWFIIIGILCLFIDRPIGIITSITLFICALISFIYYFHNVLSSNLSSGFFDALFGILVCIVLGIVHLITLGLLSSIPYLISIVGSIAIFYFTYCLCEDKISYMFKPPIRYNFLTKKELRNYKEYVDAEKYDAKMIPVLTKNYEESYKNAVQKCDDHNRLIQQNIDIYKSELSCLLGNLRTFKINFEKMLDKFNLIHKDDCNLETVYSLIYLFDHRRADSLKEALQLMDESKFRKELLGEIRKLQELQKLNIILHLKQLEENRNLRLQIQNISNNIGYELIKIRNEMSSNMESMKNENALKLSNLSKSIQKSSSELTESIKKAQDAFSNTIYKSTSDIQRTIITKTY